jgi:hypothetical protein
LERGKLKEEQSCEMVRKLKQKESTNHILFNKKSFTIEFQYVEN